jgi:peptidoglycan/LPS O-acetylase OafA/YrhL
VAALHRPVLRYAALLGLPLYAVRTLVPATIDHYWGHIVCGIGATLLIVAAAEGRLTVLGGRMAQGLGRLSYSFYLVHLPLLLLAVSWLPGQPKPLAWALALAAALAVAAMLHWLAELPTQRLGRRLGTLASGRAVRAPV